MTLTGSQSSRPAGSIKKAPLSEPSRNCWSNPRGNQCQKGLGIKVDEEVPNLYAWKRDTLMALEPGEGKRGTIGLPLALGMYELLPLWHAFFRPPFLALRSMLSRRLYQSHTRSPYCSSSWSLRSS